MTAWRWRRAQLTVGVSVYSAGALAFQTRWILLLDCSEDEVGYTRCLSTGFDEQVY